MPPRLSIHTTDDPPPSTGKGKSSTPLLALAPTIMEEEQAYFTGQAGEELGISEVWHAKAAVLVKDGHRLENLAWRNWSQQRRQSTHPPLHCDTSRRTLSFTSTASDSTASLSTPGIEFPPSPTTSTSSRSERQTFTDALRRLMPENEFTDWVTEARHQKSTAVLSPPALSVPDTPIANLEIRLVEPTPVPSRVGSLGGSISVSGLLNVSARPPRLTEEPEAEEVVDEEASDDDAEDEAQADEGQSSDALRIRSKPKSTSRGGKKKGKFFVHSSPSKGSGSDSATSPSTMKSPPQIPVDTVQPPSPTTSNISRISEGHDRRRSSASSSGIALRKKSPRSPEKKRHVSLSTMRGRFTAEKRRAAEKLERKAEEEARLQAEAEEAAAAEAEGSGWEDEEEDGEEEEEEEEEGDWSDDDEEKATEADDTEDTPETGSETAYGPRRSRHRWPELRDPPPPPAPTPLKKMGLQHRQMAKAERERIEAELEARQKREMFAKKQIFGTQKPVNSEGLLSGIFKRGASMVNLVDQTPASPPLRPSPTHGNLPNLGRSPLLPTPALLRSKSAVAMPVQTGISVTRVSPKRSRLSEEIGSAVADDRAASQSPDITTEMRRSRTHRSSDTSSKSAKSQRTSSSKERKIPEDVELESDESEEEDQYLATSTTRQKLAQLNAKAEAKGKAKQAEAEAGSISPDGLPGTQPMPMALSNVVLDERGVVMPMTPVTRRRAVLQRELSESLRRNLILERQKSSGGQKRHASFGPVQHSRPPPSTHTSLLPARHSSANLANHPVLARHRSDRSEHVDGRTTPQHEVPPRSSPSPSHGAEAVNGPAEPVRRRTQPNVLGGFLRPLTRVGIDGQGPRVGFVEPEMPHRNRSGLGEHVPFRTQSSTDLTTAVGEQTARLSPSPGDMSGSNTGSRAGSTVNLASTAAGVEQGYEAPAMMRRATEGGLGHAHAHAHGHHHSGLAHAHPHQRPEWSDDIARRRELVRRSVAQDNGYRTHGW